MAKLTEQQIKLIAEANVKDMIENQTNLVLTELFKNKVQEKIDLQNKLRQVTLEIQELNNIITEKELWD